MLAGVQGLLSILGVSVVLAAHNDDLDVGVGEELVGGAVVLGFRVVDGAMGAGLGRFGVLRSFCALEECDDLVLGKR